MLITRTWLLIGIVGALLIGTGGIIFCTGKPQSSELLLNNYPALFRKDAMIIIRENASQTELDSSEAIASKLQRLTGNKPQLKRDTEIRDDARRAHNLIIVGIGDSDGLLLDVYETTNATRVTSAYPGATKGILEILTNPWNENKALFLITGSDLEGVMNSTLTLIIEEERIGSLAVCSVEVNLLNEAWVSKINSFVRDEILEDALGNPSVDVNVIFSHKPTMNETRELEDLGIVLDLDEWSQPMELTASGACPVSIPTNRLSEMANFDYVIQISRW